MDDATIGYYNENAAEVARSYESAGQGVAALFPFVFSKGERVLDIGCGSGRDLAILRRLGVDAYGVEPAARLRAEAERIHPELRGRIFESALPDRPPEIAGGRFDAVLLSAVVMHIPESELFDSAFAIRESLVDGGSLLVSFSTERGDAPPGDGRDVRDSRGRMMVVRSASRIRLLFERLGFVVQSEWSSADAAGRPDVAWASLLFRYSGSVPRPVDRLESILNADRKVATYKFALIRALCDLAMTGYNSVTWTSDGLVAIPVSSVAELWVRYYWPLFDSPMIIPQINGETRNAKPVGFREALTKLIEHYRKQGGLPAFAREAAGETLGAEAGRLHRAAVAKIASIIVRGPVQFSGGAIGRREFGLDRTRGMILIDADFWREVVLMAHWIHDAVIVRWAEKSVDLAAPGDGIEVGDVLERLLRTSGALRADTEVRAIYEKQPSLECVWSGRNVRSGFEVDHALPFALWQDSSSWNLFPAARTVNNEKRDKLPTRGLVKRRRDAIITYWCLLESVLPKRFQIEARKLAGGELSFGEAEPRNWETLLYSKFIEAIEYTATMRGVPRWEP